MEGMFGGMSAGAMRFGVAVLFLAGTGGAAIAQTRAECEAGIAAVRGRLAQAPDAGRRAELERALRIAERELGEGEYDECMDAVEDAGLGTPGAPAPGSTARLPEGDERTGADEGLPVSVGAGLGHSQTKFRALLGVQKAF